MSEWPEARLAEVARIRHGGTPSKSNPAFWSGDVPWVSPKDFNGGELAPPKNFISKDAISSSAACIVPAGTVLAVVRSGVLAHSFPVALAEMPLSFNQDIKALIPDERRIMPRFLYHFLRSAERDIVRRGVKRGATVHSLQNGFLEHLSVRLPPVAEQRRIADILDRAAHIRRLRRQAQDLARKIIPALFIKMFGDPATNPMGWPMATIGAVGDVQGGLQVTRARASLALERPYLRVGNVLRGKLDLSEIKTIRLSSAEWRRVALRQGDILIVEGHGNSQEVGRAAAWDGSIPACVHQNHLIRLRTYPASDPQYVVAFLNSPAGGNSLSRRGKTTSGLNTISVSNVQETPIPLPPTALQHQFAQLSAHALRVAAALEAAVETDDATMASLQARLLEPASRPQ